MKIQRDVVIIGAGPAGAACALTLKKYGASPLLIDRESFPRRKTCGGLVTGKTYRLIKALLPGEDTGRLFSDSADRIRLYRGKRMIVESDPVRTMRFVDRSVFDTALVERFRSLGGELREGEKGMSVDFADSTVVLSGGDTVVYRHLVLCDGAISLSRKLTGMSEKKLGFGIEAYVPRESFDLDGVSLFFDCIDGGYAWAFPHGDKVCVGLGGRFRPETDYRAKLDRLLSDCGLSADKVKCVGAFLPYGYVVPQGRLPHNVLLAGDAGGFADPMTGEGLYPALRTGLLAARAMLTPEPKKAYLKQTAPLMKNIRDGSRVHDLFFLPRIYEGILKRLSGSSRFLSFFYDNCVDEMKYPYRALPKLYQAYRAQKNFDGSDS